MKFEIDPFSIVLRNLDRPHDGGTLYVGRAGGWPIIQQFIIYLQRTSERHRVIKFDPLAEAQNYAADSHHANLVEIARWEFISDAELIW
jgi:hypothetical protein